jgi:hypothetical protein
VVQVVRRGYRTDGFKDERLDVEQVNLPVLMKEKGN